MSEVYTDWIRPASQINLIVEEEILPCVRIQVTHHFFGEEGDFSLVQKSRRGLVAWHLWYHDLLSSFPLTRHYPNPA